MLRTLFSGAGTSNGPQTSRIQHFAIIKGCDDPGIPAIEDPANGASSVDIATLHVVILWLRVMVAQVTTSSVDTRFVAQDYDVQLLRIPALSLVSLWLKAANDEAFVAVDPTDPPFIAGVAYSRADLERVLAARAAERLKCDDAPMLLAGRL